MNERSTATRRTLARTRWLTELAQTLELAGKVAIELGSSQVDCGHAAQLRRQINALRLEVDSLRRAKPAEPIEPYPEWMM